MRKLFLILAVILALIVMLVPTAAFAAAPTLNGRTYYGTGAYEVWDMDGTKVATYRGLAVVFTGQADTVVSGTVRLYTVSNIRGTYLSEGTANMVPISLVEGNNTVLLYSSGDLSLILPAGVQATATSGSALVTGSPLSLAAGGTRTIPTTTGGVFTLNVARSYTTIGTFAGVVGNTGTPARFQLGGTQLYATATEDGATMTGSPVTCLPGSTTLDITAAGTVDVAVPYGMSGTVTSGTATVTGSPVTLPAGATTEFTTGVTTGTATVALNTLALYNIAGKMGLTSAGVCTYLRGRIDGYVVTEFEGYSAYSMNEAIKLVYTP